MGNNTPNTRGQPGANWSLQDVTDFIEHCFDRDTILDVLMGYSGYWFPARLTLIVGRAWVQLFAAEGWELGDHLPRDARRADVDPTAPAITERVVTGTPEDIGLGELFEQLNIDAELVRTIGIPIGDRIAIVLVGKVRDDAVDTSNLEGVADVAGDQLEDVIRRAKQDTLPPPEERVPPFPERRTSKSQGASPTPQERDVRHTQQLDSSPSPSQTLNAPRLAASEPSEVDEESGATEEAVDPNATSFGLPFSTKVDREATIEAAAEGERVAAAEDAAAEEERVAAEEEAAATPGMPAASSADEQSEAEEYEEDDTFIGSPFEQQKFPGDLGEESDSVSTMPPNSVGDEHAFKTQLGGITAEPNIISQQRAEEEYADSSAAEESTPSDVAERDRKPTPLAPRAQKRRKTPSDNAGSTLLGGLEGETRLVDQALGRPLDADTEAAEAEKDEKAEKDKKTEDAGSGGWEDQRTESGLPKAMILKPAKARSARDKKADESTAEAEEKAPAAFRKPSRRAPGSEVNVDSSPAEAAPSSADEDQGAAPAIGTAADDIDEISDAADSGSTSETMFGGGWAEEQETTRKFEIEDDVDDAWFDYFADVAEDKSPAEEDQGDALQFSLSEPSEDDPHSLPPETLERLLDSGPEVVDMQEQFLILDSRDRTRAMEAAEEVAEMGDTALEVLDLMFPGRIFLDRYQYAGKLPPVNEHGPVLHALVRIGDPAVTVAKHHMVDASNETRFYAVFLLTKVNAEPALAELVPRLFDRDQQTRDVAARIVQDYAGTPQFDELIRHRLHDELMSDDLHATVSADLLGELRDVEAIPRLIDALQEADSSGVAASLMEALRTISLHDWSSPYEWRQWWDEAADQTRRHWIVEGLDASSEKVRRLVHKEIQRIPGLELNYHPDQPSKLRKRAQKQLREWYDAIEA